MTVRQGKISSLHNKQLTYGTQKYKLAQRNNLPGSNLKEAYEVSIRFTRTHEIKHRLTEHKVGIALKFV